MSRSPAALAAALLEDEHEHAVGGADRQQVEHDRLDRDDERAERESRSRNARPSTNANTSGALRLDQVDGVLGDGGVAVTTASTPRTWPTVAGTRSSRIVASAAMDVSSVPLPAIGIVTWAEVLSVAISTSVASIAVFVRRPWLEAARSRCATSGLVTSSALTTTVAAAFSPGNASVMRSYVLIAGVSFGSSSMPALAVCMPSAGRASATSRPPETTRRNSGRLSTRSSTAVHRRASSRWAMRLPRNGMRPLLMRSPSLESIAGRTVSEPIIAMATTRIVPIAIEAKPLSPVMNMPAMAAMTVKPETSTARPEVAAAASSAASGSRPAPAPRARGGCRRASSRRRPRGRRA